MFSLILFGGAVLEGPGGAVTGPAAQRRRLVLLAVLAAARSRPVGRERLIGLLWPEHPSDAARHLLSESLYVLRKKLGDGAFSTGGDEVVLRAECVRSDVAEFEVALEADDVEAAARLYRGPFLEGVYVPDAPELERWVEAERDRLARMYARAVERVAERLEGERRSLDAAEWWRKAAACDPFSSRVAVRLMRALDAAGERAAAIRAAEAHATLLREELGVAPDAEMVAFVERLRAEAARAAKAAAVPPPPPSLVDARADTDDETAEEVSGGDESVAREAELEGGLEGDDIGDATAASPHPASPRPRRRRRFGAETAQSLAYYAGLVGMVAGLVLSVFPARRALEKGPAEVAEVFDPRRIAVLYIEDNSERGTLGYLAKGLTEHLIERLTQVEALHVISASGVRRLRDEGIEEVAARLKVGSVFRGTVEQTDSAVYLTVHLINGQTGAYVGSRTLHRPVGEQLALEQALAEEVSQLLRKWLGPEVRLREVRDATWSEEAYESVLRAEKMREEALATAQRQDALDTDAAFRQLHTADSLLAKAHRIDRRWVDPLVLRGRIALNLASLAGGSARTAHLDAAMRFAGRALEMDARSAAALEVRGTALWRIVSGQPDASPRDPRLDRAEADLRAAVNLERSRATAWSTLSQFLRFKGALAAAREAAETALAEDAFLDDANLIYDGLFRISLMLEDYPAARDWCARGKRDFPGDWRFVECTLNLLREDPSAPADPKLAWSIVDELDRIQPPDKAAASGDAYHPIYRRIVAATVAARAGERDSARAVLARAHREFSDTSAVRIDLLYDESYLHLAMGDRDEALRLIGVYLAAYPNLKDFIARDPLFKPLRADPRFRAMLRSARAPSR